MELGIDMHGLESMCRAMYEGQDQKQREEAEKTLMPLGESAENVVACFSIISGSSEPLAQVFAAACLLKIADNHWTRIPEAQRVELWKFCYSLLAERGPGLASYVVADVTAVFCRVTKLGWNDEGPYRSIVDDVSKFLEASEEHCDIGLIILNRITIEMNQSTPAIRKFFSQAQNRKVATSFRDLLLLRIFELSLSTLTRLSPPPAHSALRLRALQLAQSCLGFDFIGASFDEASEDMGTIHVPVAWRAVIEDPKTLTLFFDTYNGSANVNAEVAGKTIECLVQLSSIRRSIFSTDEKRLNYLYQHMRATVEVLSNNRGLDQPETYHHFCRWLSRLKANHELSELMGSDLFPDWIRNVAELTLHCISSDWSIVGNSLYYLLNLWSKLVHPISKLKRNSSTSLETYVEKIVQMYVTSRLHALQSETSPSDWDNLDDEENIAQEEFAEHLESIPAIFRLHYDKTAQFLIQLIDPLLEQYKAGITNNVPAVDRFLLERHLAWLVRVSGSVVGGRIISTSSENQEHSDGELSSRVFQLMIYTVDEDRSRSKMGVGKQPRGMIELDGAIVDFIQSFRKAYIGEQAVSTSKVYVRMSERLGISDHIVVLDVVASKIACILQKYGIVCGTAVVKKTLQLLSDLAFGHSSGRLLGKLKTIRSMLNNHGEESFLFMKGSSMGQQRTLFYQTLTKILFSLISLGEFDPEAEFERFLQPLQLRLEAIAAVQSDEMMINDPEVSNALIGALRDLRGIVTATLLKKTYTMFFDWFYPQHVPLLYRAIRVAAAAGSYPVCNPLLKFYAELVSNKPPRIIFDPSSPNGILLFRETSKIIVSYCTATLAQWNAAGRQGSDPYRQLYKGAATCLLMFSRSLSGNYVNFGVFGLYGDTALEDALRVSLEIALAIPVKDLLAYQKVSKAYFSLMDNLCANHASSIVAVEHDVFVHIVSTLQEGLSVSDVWSHCTEALDHLSEFRFRSSMKDTQNSRNFAAHLERSPNLFPTCLETVFTLILHEDCTNQWSLSRPLLSLILTNEGSYGAHSYPA
mmetsp:Transcript_37087/g.148002  ORF Transcript_37087/g.148002 Transcript_37087/m.148002 type:complete len:1034 (-) Transcript_37087:449-3550(-)